jgi:hypothetical protein
MVTESEVADAKTVPPATASKIDTVTANRLMFFEFWIEVNVMLLF